MTIVVVRARLRLDGKGHLQLGHPLRKRSDPRAIGHQLRRMRRQQGITLPGAAAYLGCGAAAIRPLEHGEDAPPAWMVMLYLQMLGYEVVLTGMR